jgi:ribosomal protein S17E
MRMLTNDRVFMLLDIIVKKCLLRTVEYKVNINKYYVDSGSEYDMYELKVRANAEDDGFLSSNIDLSITFCFEEKLTEPYLSMNFTDSWDSCVKIHNFKEVKRYKKIIIELYEESMHEQFNEILKRSQDYFDIDKSDIRDVKISNIIEDE